MKLLSLLNTFSVIHKRAPKAQLTHTFRASQADCVAHRDQNANTQFLVFPQGLCTCVCPLSFDQASSKRQFAIIAFSIKD